MKKILIILGAILVITTVILTFNSSTTVDKCEQMSDSTCLHMDSLMNADSCAMRQYDSLKDTIKIVDTVEVPREY